MTFLFLACAPFCARLNRLAFTAQSTQLYVSRHVLLRALSSRKDAIPPLFLVVERIIFESFFLLFHTKFSWHCDTCIIKWQISRFSQAVHWIVFRTFECHGRHCQIGTVQKQREDTPFFVHAGGKFNNLFLYNNHPLLCSEQVALQIQSGQRSRHTQFDAQTVVAQNRYYQIWCGFAYECMEYWWQVWVQCCERELSSPKNHGETCRRFDGQLFLS